MYIKQWLQEPLQKRQCTMIIHETLWELGVLQKQGVYITKRSEGCAADYSTKGRPYQVFIPTEGWLDNEIALFYNQILEYKFDRRLDDYVKKLLKEGKPLQNTMDSKGNIRTGANNDVACFIFGTLQGLIREKYAVI